MLKVMFLCTGNSCRSQMAEGFARRYGAGLVEAYSAGLSPAGLNPVAVEVMKEIGIDISGQSSKAIDPDTLSRMDVVITLCSHAGLLCPSVGEGVRRLSRPVDDPTGTTGSREKVLSRYRAARDEIMGLVVGFIRGVRG